MSSVIISIQCVRFTRCSQYMDRARPHTRQPMMFGEASCCVWSACHMVPQTIQGQARVERSCSRSRDREHRAWNNLNWTRCSQEAAAFGQRREVCVPIQVAGASTAGSTHAAAGTAVALAMHSRVDMWRPKTRLKMCSQCTREGMRATIVTGSGCTHRLWSVLYWHLQRNA
jgi:hypothetical protein